MLFHRSLSELREREREKESTHTPSWCSVSLRPAPCAPPGGQGLHDNWPGRPQQRSLCSLGWKEHRERSEEGAVGSSQQVSGLKPVDLGTLGSLTGCGVSQTLPRMEWAGKHRDFQVRAAPDWIALLLSWLWFWAVFWAAGECLYSLLRVWGSGMMSCSNSWILLAPGGGKQPIFLTLQI